jgi:hypothetical protein
LPANEWPSKSIVHDIQNPGFDVPRLHQPSLNQWENRHLVCKPLFVNLRNATRAIWPLNVLCRWVREHMTLGLLLFVSARQRHRLVCSCGHLLCLPKCIAIAALANSTSQGTCRAALAGNP